MTKSADWRPLYPFQSREIMLAGHRCHYVDEGQGPTLLLVHGNPTWSFYWREIDPGAGDRYRARGPRPDRLRISDKPSAKEYSYRLDRRVADLNEFVEKLDLRRITLVAHDWGGAVGMGAAVAAPDRFARFALMNTAAFPRADVSMGNSRLPDSAVRTAGRARAESVRPGGAENDRGQAGANDPGGPGGIGRRPTTRGATGRACCGSCSTSRCSPKHPTYSTLKRIEAGLAQFRDRPVCLIWGMQDWCFTPWFLDRFIDIFPQAEVHRLAGRGPLRGRGRLRADRPAAGRVHSPESIGGRILLCRDVPRSRIVRRRLTRSQRRRGWRYGIGGASPSRRWLRVKRSFGASATGVASYHASNHARPIR